MATKVTTGHLPPSVPHPSPTKRRLRVYAFDPNASVALETAVINDAEIELPWEQAYEDPVTIGPTNEYLEIIDYDFPSRTFYEPLDLNDPALLAQNGLPLSEGRPQFHQQMVFAVAMKTILDFERALGRPVFWAQPEVWKFRAPDGSEPPINGRYYPDFIKRLRIYPHAMLAANAYYSPAKAALLFGYFKGAPPAPGLDAPWVFTALSQDIIAHETTHAILHGMRRRSVEASNEDSLAFHEGFADIVALMQHFSMRRVVEHELARTRGLLRSVSLLTGLAEQFGWATGRRGALRKALDTLGEEQRAMDRALHNASVGRTGGEAEAAAKVKRISDVAEPHERGQFLVAAIFDAFVTIYERRTLDLFRMTGTVAGQQDALPEALATRLAAEACKSAASVMQMCVRALDYLPAVSATFGEYLRAIMTADTDLYPDDPLKYRVAIAEAFRKRGIPVPGCLSYAPESLCWEAPDMSEFSVLADGADANTLFADALGGMIYTPRFAEPGTSSRRTEEESRPESAPPKMPWELRNDFINYSEYRDPGVHEPNMREESMRIVLHNQRALHRWLERSDGAVKDRLWEKLLGLRLRLLDAAEPCQTIECRTTSSGRRAPKFEVHSVRIARRRTVEGRELYQLIAQVTQKRYGYFDPNAQREADEHGPKDAHALEDPDSEERVDSDFVFLGGATIIVNLNDGRLTHIVRKRIDKDERLAEQRRFILGDEAALAMTVDGMALRMEPFCFMHGGHE